MPGRREGGRRPHSRLYRFLTAVTINEMIRCRHDNGLAARWDHLFEDETCGTGWIVCRSCMALLQRVTVAGGKFRGGGRYLDAFKEQISHESPFAELADLEID